MEDSKRAKVIKELELVSVNKVSEPKDAFLFHGLDLIFNKTINEKLNILEEKIMVYSIALEALFNYNVDKLNKLVEENGVFLVCTVVEEIFKHDEDFLYFQRLYKEHKQNKIFEDNTKNIEKIVSKVIQNVVEGIRDINIEDIQKNAAEIQKTLNGLGVIKNN